MIKRYHEAPISIFGKVQQVTDGDYALVHLFETNDLYYNLFVQAVNKGRDVLLDNSLFELGSAFDSDRYVDWINRLKPTWYIVPDSWKNGEETTRMFFEFLNRYPIGTLPGKIIGVAQGNTIEEVAKCYESIEPYCDKVAFNLDFSSYSDTPKAGVPHCLRMSIGRWKMICDLYNNDVINRNKPHHLLGCGVPQEMMWYNKKWKWIDSVDTCNPVIHGMYQISYDKSLPGLTMKKSQKMCDLIDEPIDDAQLEIIMRNIEEMKRYCQ